MLKRVVHPGEVLKDELEELGMSPMTFACQIGAAPSRISQIIAGKCSVTRDMALRFGHWFGTGSQFWLNIQRQIDFVEKNSFSTV